MSDDFIYVFPADPRQPKTDWPSLRRQLLQHGFMAERPLRQVGSTLRDLARAVLAARGEASAAVADIADVDDLTAFLRSHGVPIEDGADLAELGISEFITLLEYNGAVPPGFAFDWEESFMAGPVYVSFCEGPRSRPPAGAQIHFEDYGDQIKIHCGPDLLMPPSIPESERVVEDWSEFMTRYVHDPNETWTDPETGRAYGLLDLDWENTLAACRCCLTVLDPGYLSGEKLAGFVSKLTGQPYRWSWMHL